MLLHIIIILSVPHFSNRDAYSRVMAEGEANSFYLLSENPDKAGLANGDPTLRVAVCSFSVAEAPVQVTSSGQVPFWSMAVYDQRSNEVFSTVDRTSVAGVPDIVIATPAQLNSLRKNLPADAAQSILVEMPNENGFVVLRAWVPLPSMEEAARDFLKEADCSQM